MYPHSPDVAVRETMDNGFSRGYGLHFQPSEEYWLDCHNHLETLTTREQIAAKLDQWFARLDAYRLGKVLVFCTEREAFPIYGEFSRQDPRFGWLVRVPHDKPDTVLFEDAVAHGAIGLKLHNYRIMQGEGDYRVWLNDEWAKMFEIAERHGLPVLWHITQRHSVSPYHGGGEFAYWKEGWAKGVTFTNEDLLGVALEILRRFPKLKLIGAHQIHLGLDRLSQLFDEYENLYIDSSCGFFLRWADTFYEEDRIVLRNFFHKYQDRILFGSDTALATEEVDEYLVQSFLCHARFVLQLRLEYDVLQKVAHRNAERVFGLAPIKPAQRGYTRP
jgi:predicted TIM-barrel fold metal-dependent hydrolase